MGRQLSFVRELKDRNVFRVAIAYLALAWLLTEVAGTLLPAFGVPDWAFRFIVIALALAFVPVLVFSWVYEITPDGLKRERELVRDESVTHLTARRLDFLTIGLVVAAVAFVLVDRLWLSDSNLSTTPAPGSEIANSAPTSPAGSAPAANLPPSIAVLPFANRSADPQDGFFVDGIHDDLLTHISRIGAIKTISRTSVLRYRESDKSIPEIAQELGVATILEGGVQRAGDTVRINVELIDAQTDEHIWAEIYDRNLSTANIFAIQTEISESIARELQAKLSPNEKQQLRAVPTRDLAAYEAYMLGRQRLAQFTTGSTAEAVTYFRQAVEHDPEYGLAWAALGEAYIAQVDLGSAPQEETWPKAQAALEQALVLNNDLGEAHTWLGVLAWKQADPVRAERAFRHALESSPNYPPINRWYGVFLESAGRWEESLSFRAAAVELDPMSPEQRRSYATALRQRGRTEEALQQLSKALEIDPDFVGALDAIATIQWQVLQEHAESAKGAVRLISADPMQSASYVWLSQHYLDLGALDRAEKLMARAVALSPEHAVTAWGQLLLNVYRQASQDAAEDAATVLTHSYGAHWHREFAVAQLRNEALSRGRTDEALSVYSRYYPDLLSEEEPVVDLRNYRAAVDLALVLKMLGDDARADALLQRASNFIAGQPRLGWWGGYWISDAQILALQGRNKEALAQLRRAFQEGWRSLWWYYLPSDPNLASIRNEPEFQAIEREIKADMARHMDKIRQLERSGEIGSVPGVVFENE